jgi:hypothetical protein
MKFPKASTLALVGVGLCLLGSVSIAPNATRRTVTRNDGSTYSEVDVWKYVRGNWFGFATYAAGGISLILAAVRFGFVISKDKHSN